MKGKKLFSAMLLAIMAAGCSQDEFIASGNLDENVVKNGFSEYKGVPFTGEINFSRDEEAMTRMGLQNGNYAFVEGDRVGLVWTNASAINEAIASYDVTKESWAMVRKPLQDQKICATWSQDDECVGYKYTAKTYNEAVQAGNETPVDGSYVWIEGAKDYKIFSNTRMTYETINGEKKWHMTDGQIFKGDYFAYSPYDPALQSISKFRVKQSAHQVQKSSNAADLESCSNHILDDKTGLVWISQNIPAATASVTQHLSFIYPLQEQNNESGTAEVVNIQMRPFSNILDTRLTVKKGTMDEANAKKIKIESVDLIANDKVFATTAAFDMSKWGTGKASWQFGVYALKYDNSDPKPYTWNTAYSEEGKYVGEDLVNTVTTEIAEPTANNGVSQRVQLMLLPRYYANQGETMSASTTYTLRINTDYGYIEIPEIKTTGYGWQKSAPGKEGVVVNPVTGSGLVDITGISNDENKLNYVLAKIGARATRYISFNANDLVYDRISISNKQDLLDAINKWNELGKNGEFTVVPTKDCVIENLIWNESDDMVSLEHYKLYENGQGVDRIEELGQAEQIIVDFLANPRNSLKIDGALAMGGTNAIDADRLTFTNAVNLKEGTLAITNANQEFAALNIAKDAKAYVANNANASLSVNSASKWAGEATVYAQGAINVNENLTNIGTLNINGTFTIATGKTFTNDIENEQEGEVNLFANAKVSGDNSAFINNSIFNYVDRPTAFIKAVMKNNSRIYAAIADENKESHRSEYLNAANAFGATDLTIEGNEIAAEWNNLNKLTSFNRVLMRNLTLRIFQDITFSSSKAIVTVEGVVTLEKNTTGATPNITVKQFVLSDNATLTIEKLNVMESTLTEMGNNTTLNGYNNFTKNSQEPTKKGNGFHNVLDEDGNEMFPGK